MSTKLAMLREISSYGLEDKKVLSVLRKIPRENFVSHAYRKQAYADKPLPIGYSQTISQPFTVAFMTHLLNLKGGEKILEIGTGSGYQAAVLAHLSREVYTIERVAALCQKARKNLKRLGFKNVKVRCGQGELGWKSKAPFDAILVTAEIIDKIPKALIEQLKDGGVLVGPVRGRMWRVTKKGKKIKKEDHGPFRFVPLVEEKA